MNFLLSRFRAIPTWFWVDICLPVVASRLLLILVAWLGFQLLQPRVFYPHAWELANNGKVKTLSGPVSKSVRPFLNMWSRWDAAWYISVAKTGYSFNPLATSNTAFFPLYPATMRLVHGVFRLPGRESGWALAGIIASNIALLVAMTYCFLLVRLDFDQATASRCVLYLSVFPATLFFSAVYTESLFLALVAAAFYYARKERWLIASLLGAGAALCRAPGFLLIIPLAAEYLAQRKFDWRQVRANSLWLALIPAALAGHLAHMRFRFGDWDIIGKSQDAFAREFVLLPVTIWQWFQQAHPVAHLDVTAIDFVFLIIFIVLTWFIATRLRVSYFLYTLLSLGFVSTWGFPNSLTRYALVIFPFFIVLALFGRNEAFHRSYLILGTGLAALWMLMFSQWIWIA